MSTVTTTQYRLSFSRQSSKIFQTKTNPVNDTETIIYITYTSIILHTAPALLCLVLNWEQIHREQSSLGKHGAHLGPVGPRWPHVGPMNLAIRVIYPQTSDCFRWHRGKWIAWNHDNGKYYCNKTTTVCMFYEMNVFRCKECNFRSFCTKVFLFVSTAPVSLWLIHANIWIGKVWSPLCTANEVRNILFPRVATMFSSTAVTNVFAYLWAS